MFKFWRKEQKEVLESEEYHKLKKEITALALDVSSLESLIFKMGNDIKNLRAYAKKKMFDALTDTEEESKGINRSVLLPE